MSGFVEYKVRPVTRYIVTRYDEGGQGEGGPWACGSQPRGEYHSDATAYEVAYALCKAEHDASGEPVDSMKYRYPDPIDHQLKAGSLVD